MEKSLWQWSPSCQHEVLLCLPGGFVLALPCGKHWSCKCLRGEGQEQEPMSWALGMGEGCLVCAGKCPLWCAVRFIGTNALLFFCLEKS